MPAPSPGINLSFPPPRRSPPASYPQNNCYLTHSIVSIYLYTSHPSPISEFRIIASAVFQVPVLVPYMHVTLAHEVCP